MKFKLQLIAITTLILACGFTAGYSWRGELNTEAAHAEFVAGQQDVTAYVEDCTLERARAGQCSIPCASDADCVAKNGSRDNY
jgi:hypothetical protein